MPEPIVWIDETTRNLTAVAGAKMGRLSELHAAGIRVPNGFTITVDAYREHCAESGLDTVIDRAVSGLSADSVAHAAAEIRAAFNSRPVPPALAEAVSAGYQRLAQRCGNREPRTAVRSSAIGEDSASASFAGIFDSYLGISGPVAVLDAVRSCWASLFTDRALAYRLRNRISHHDMPIAVGVTELIDARASGVAFSIHPVTGKTDRIVIEANWGWGETVVQGLVTPDRAEIGKTDRRLLRYQTNHKTVLSTFDSTAGRVIETAMPAEKAAARALDDDEALMVADAVRTIERHYGHPVDVEWVVDTEGTVYAVQSRPVTVTAKERPATGWDAVAAANRYAFGRNR